MCIGKEVKAKRMEELCVCVFSQSECALNMGTNHESKRQLSKIEMVDLSVTLS